MQVESRAFEPARLLLARRRRGLKRSQLAVLAGLKPRTLAAYELSEREPSDDALARLQNALGFPREFFFRGAIPQLREDGVAFRALSKMTAPQREKALAAGELASELLEWAKSRFDLPAPNVPDLRLEKDPETAALALRAAWGMGDRPIPNLIKLLEAHGVRVFSLVEHDRALDGFSFWRAGEPFIFLNTLKSAERCRFDAAHELGHLVLHRHGGGVGPNAEREAMEFASSFLMPSSSVRSHVTGPVSITELLQVKQWWGVSLAALVKRLHDVKIINNWVYRETFMQLQGLGYRDNEPNGIVREHSLIWPQIFDEMRKEGSTRADVARLLGWPVEELQSLVFQLVISGLSGGNATAPQNSNSDARSALSILH
ncbi:XRE family transcriptional regulator [Pseudogemmatithrix spongiicola]|uniref:XRE family transcriptional regulator n=1 Tax=Pseudogemmatithrix spongiicola TaxID=3062599 RepID=A0AA49JZH1_9BACT|nr:XRE family transcriptional regulator [Gemmatimonadaceae bacterium 'strain 138']WKW14719.1 XRE family transcriptional regulator [Gemmatimonadaceae bacterium 'strain 318']